MKTRFRFSSDELPESLYGSVLAAVGRARRRASRIRLAISSLFIGISGAGIVLTVRDTLAAAQASGFASFASLALSDTSVVVRHAQEFLLSLIETMPGLDVAALLLGLSVFLVSLRTFVRALPQGPAHPLTTNV